MPRTGALLSLSREHHTALVLARTALRAADAAIPEGPDPAVSTADAIRAATAAIESHWHATMASHFEREERLIQSAKDALDAQSVQRITAEHAELRMLAGGPCELEPADRLRRFANLVRAHVRYEERVLFPQLQARDSVGDGGDNGGE
jgi:hemerythrin-like domain-containing protein